MRRSVVVEGSVLVPPWLVGVVAAAAAVTLVAIFPRKLLSHDGHRDLVSLTYERLQLFRHPEDRQLRLALADDEVALGELALAAHTLEPLLVGEILPADVEARDFQVQLQLWRAVDGSSAERATMTATLARRLQVDAERSFPPADRGAMALAAMELQRPDLAAGLFGSLALEEGPVGGAGLDRACQMLSGSPPPGPLCFAALAFTSALQSDGAFDAVELAGNIVARFPEDREILQQATAVAANQAQPAAAVSWWRQAAVQHPGDASALSQLLSLELSSGQLVAATDTASALLGLRPADGHLRERAATLALWAGQPERALGFWMPQAEAGDADAVRSALTLTKALSLHDTSSALLEHVSAQRPLSAEELDVLFSEAQSSMPPSQAAHLLEPILQRGGTDRAHWEQLAALELEAGRLDQVLTIRALMESRWGRTDEDTLQDATLLWRAGRTRSALARSREAKSDAARRFTAELAIELGIGVEARECYEALRNAGAISDEELGRLIALRQEAGETTAAADLAIATWRSDHEAKFLWSALDSLSSAHRWSDVRELMGEAVTREAAPIGSARWAGLTTEVDVAEGRWVEAEAAAREAFELEPGSRTLQARLLWLADKVHDRPVVSRLLDEGRPSAATDESLWPLYAAGYDHLGRVSESTAWYERVARAHPDDDAAVLSWADALARSNHTDSAHRLQAWVYGRLLAAGPTRTALGIPLAVSKAWLALDLSGPVVAHALIRQLAAKPDPKARRAAVEWLLAAGQVEEARSIAFAAPASERQRWPPADCVALAEGASNAVCAGEVADALPREQRRPGSLPAELALGADASMNSGSGYGVARAEGSSGWRSGMFRVDVSAGMDDLWRPGGPHQQGLDAGVQGSVTSGAGVTVARIGLDWRPGSPVGQLDFKHHYDSGNGLTVGSTLLVNDVAGEWGPLRADATRDWAGVDARMTPVRATSVSLEAGWQRFSTRAGAPLSDGAQVNLQVDDAPLPNQPRWRLRATLSGQLNALNLGNGERFVDGPASLWIPDRFVESGAGVSWSSGDLDDRQRRWTLLADAWAGWIWPLDRAAFRISGGAGLRLGVGMLLLNGFIASDEPFFQTGIVGGIQLQYRQEPKS